MMEAKLKVPLMQLTFLYQVRQIVYVAFLWRVDTNRIIGGGNCVSADKPCQNQIELLMGASFIQWILVCIHPRQYCRCLDKTCGFRERNWHEWYSILTWTWWKVCVNYFSGVDHGTLDQGASLLRSNRLSSAMDSQSRNKGITCCYCYCYSFYSVFYVILFYFLSVI